jgi:hypothetical protein
VEPLVGFRVACPRLEVAARWWGGGALDGETWKGSCPQVRRGKRLRESEAKMRMGERAIARERGERGKKEERKREKREGPCSSPGKKGKKEKGKGVTGERGEREREKREVKERKEKKGRERDNLTLESVQIFCDRIHVVIYVSIRNLNLI